MPDPDLIPSWNGSLERQGLVPGLSGYDGASTLAGAIAIGRPVRHKDHGVRALQITVAAYPVGPLPTPGEVRAQMALGRTIKGIARRYRLPIATIRTLAVTFARSAPCDGGAQG